MKNSKAFWSLLAFILMTSLLPAKAQNKNADEVKKMVESRNYVFKAQTVFPQTGSSRILTPDYDLTIAGDTIIAYLPYFGRAYNAPINPAEGGIKFTSTDFEYKPVKTAKGWEIMIKPKDATDVSQLNLDIFDNGSASLRVNNINRQSISFNGYIQEGKAAGKKAF